MAYEQAPRDVCNHCGLTGDEPEFQAMHQIHIFEPNDECTRCLKPESYSMHSPRPTADDDIK